MKGGDFFSPPPLSRCHSHQNVCSSEMQSSVVGPRVALQQNVLCEAVPETKAHSLAADTANTHAYTAKAAFPRNCKRTTAA